MRCLRWCVRFRPAVVLALALTAFLFTPAHAFLYDTHYAGPGFPNRVDDRIDAMLPTDYVDIIVDFCSTPTAADSTFLAGYGTVYGVFRFIDAIAVQNVLVSDCYLIVNYPRLKLIELDELLTPQMDVSCYAIKARSSGVYAYPSDAVWDLNPSVGYMGNGVNVAIIDSGVDDGHPALAGKFVAGYNGFTGLGGPGVNPDDDMVGWFHGTTIAGIIMGNDPAQQYMGVAPGAGLVDCKIFDATGSSPSSRTVATIQWVMSNAALYNIQVCNLSIGGFPDDGTNAVARAANALAASGVVVVGAAGNNPPAVGISAPGSGDQVICVGGVTDNATVARGDDVFDSAARVGPRASPPPTYALSQNDLKPDVSAYIRDITTCLGVNPGQNATGWWQHPGSGTSWATAHVSGVVALLLEKYPGLPPNQVENLLRTNAEPRGAPTFPSFDPIWNYMYGWGIVSAADAVNAVMTVDVSVSPWVPGYWNSKSIWAGHYPVQVGDPNTLNARVYASGGFAPSVVVSFEIQRTGWGTPYAPIASTTVNVPAGGSVVATIPFTPLPHQDGHKCFRVTATYSADPNLANNVARENIDIQAAKGARLVQVASSTSTGSAPSSRADHRYAFGLEMCTDPMATVPFRTADACICTKDLPVGADAYLDPEPPFDLMPGQCQPCSLIITAPEGVVFGPEHAVYVNGWFWGNGVAEGGVAVHFESVPPHEVTIAEIQYTDDLAAPASPLEGQTVTVSGIATTEDTTFPERFAIQDGEAPWSGLFIKNAGLPVARGDSLTITGTVVETEGLTEIDYMTDMATVSSGNPVPNPVVLDPLTVDTDESYEGMLVRVEDVSVTDNTYDNWEVTAPPGDTCRVGRWAFYGYGPLIGDELHVQGVSGALADKHKIQPRDNDDIEYASGVSDDELPTVVSLSQNLPNPFEGKTGIAYTLPRETEVELRVYNVAGKLVRTLVDGTQPAGRWKVIWDGNDENEHAVSNGVYFYRLRAGGKTIARRMVLIE